MDFPLIMHCRINFSTGPADPPESLLIISLALDLPAFTAWFRQYSAAPWVKGIAVSISILFYPG
jgi:hypothetical protein